MIRLAILKNREVILEKNFEVWSAWFEWAARHVGRDRIGDVVISTVFLGMDHGSQDDGPLWFETMVFGGPLDGETVRYETYDQAKAGHSEMLKRVSQRSKGHE